MRYVAGVALALIILAASVATAEAQLRVERTYTLTVRVLDAKKAYCSGGTAHYVSGATVTVGSRSQTTDANGRAVFTNVAPSLRGQSYTIGSSRRRCTSSRTSFAMPHRNAETTTTLDDCPTGDAYDISAAFPKGATRGAFEIGRAGRGYNFTLVVKNNGSGAPSATNEIYVTRHAWDPERVGPGVRVDVQKSVPSLCANEEVGFDFRDANPPRGAYMYQLNWRGNPDNRLTNTNHIARKMVLFE